MGIGNYSPNSNTFELVEDSRNENLAKLEILTLSIILVLAIGGNGLMLVALRRQLNFRPMSRMYFFMLNLSIADLLVAFGNILPQLAWDITYRFKGNDSLCRLIKFLQIFVLYLSTFVLTSMAVDRYMVICHQTFSRNHHSGLKVPKLMVFLSWILAFICACPQALIFTMSEVKPGVVDCWTFLDSYDQKAYVTWFVGSVFILPLAVVAFSYGAIFLKLSRFSVPNRTGGGFTSKKPSANGRTRGRYKRKSSFSSSSIKTDSDTIDNTMAPLHKERTVGYKTLKRQISQAKIKTLNLTLVVVICFFVCWAPFCITQLIMVYHPEMTVGPLYVILLLLASLNSCTNPWIYLVFSESLCNQLRILLGLGLRRGSDEVSIGDEQEPVVPQVVEVTKGIENKGVKVVEHEMPRKNISISNQEVQDDLKLQPETKSEML